MNNTLEGMGSRITEAEWMNDLKDRTASTTTPEQDTEKRMRRNADCLRDPWGNIKSTNIHIIAVPGGEEREREDLRKYLKR